MTIEAQLLLHEPPFCMCWRVACLDHAAYDVPALQFLQDAYSQLLYATRRGVVASGKVWVSLGLSLLSTATIA